MSAVFKGPHLREVSRVPVRGDRFVVRGDQLIIGSLHAEPPRELTIVDISTPAAPSVKASLPFKYQMSVVESVGDIIYVSEYNRAIHLIRIDDATPVTFDCHLMFRQEINELAALGSRWLVAARNWQGVSVLDVADPARPVETDARKLGESYVESVLVVGERVFAAANADGLVELRIDENGKLVEVGRWLGGEDGFRVDRVFAIGGELWVFGNGTLPYTAPEESEANAATDDDEDVDDEEDAEEEDADEEKAAIEVGEEDDDDEDDEYEEDEAEEEPNTLILSLADVGGAPVWIGASPVKPTHLCPLAGSGAISLQGYRCWHFPRAATAKVLFERRETRPDWNGLDGPREYVEGSDHNTSVPGDAACWVRRGNHLILQQPDALVIYAINPESPLATMAEE